MSNANNQLLQLLSSMISSFSLFLLNSIVVKTLNMSSFDVSILTFFSFLPFLIIILHAGDLADKFSLKSISVVTSGIQVATVFSFICLYLFSINMIGIILISILAFTIVSTSLFLDSSLNALIPRKYLDKEINKKNGDLFFFRNIGLLAGPILAGGCISYLSENSALMLLLLLNIMLVIVSIKNDEKIAPEYSDLQVGLLANLKLPLKIYNIKIMLMHGSINNLLGAIIDTSIYLLLYNSYAFTPMQIGILFFSKKLGAVISSKFFSYMSDNHLKSKLFILSMFNGFLWTVLSIDHISYRNILFILVFFVIGSNSTLINVIMSSFRQRTVSNNDQGKVLGALRFYLFIFYPLGVGVAYFLQKNISLENIFLFCGVMISLSSFIILKMKKLTLGV